MKKLNLSQTTKKTIILSLLIFGLVYLFYVLTKFSGFLYFCLAYCIGTVYNAVRQYLKILERERRFAEFESTYNVTIPVPDVCVEEVECIKDVQKE